MASVLASNGRLEALPNLGARNRSARHQSHVLAAEAGWSNNKRFYLHCCGVNKPKPASWICRAKDDEEPDWEKEMSIFNKRMSAPNQLATLRELEAKVNVGKVLFVKDSLAIVSGLNVDAPLGTKLSFVTGGTGVLLWHRSDNISFVLILGGAAGINQGTGLECKIKGVLQVIDEVKGPVTKKEFELFEVGVGDHMFGQVVDFLGQQPAGLPTHHSSSQNSKKATTSEPPLTLASSGTKRKPAAAASSADKFRPLLNTQVQMKAREQISEPLGTGVKALDLLTPLGRGASLLVIGPNDSGKSTLAEDTILGQKGTGVKVVYASTGRSLESIAELQSRLTTAGAMSNTCIVMSNPNAPLGEKYATMCAAFSIGEVVRDKGGHCLVIVDDMSPLSLLWDTLAITGLGGLGQDVARAGLIKDREGRDLPMPAPSSEQELVDYEGMLVSGAVAQRRAFFSTLFMRPAKLARSLGGGSLSALMLVPGRPATGQTKKVDMSKYQTLSEEQKAKIQAALEKRLADELSAPLAPGELSTEAVEEFISIADGQLVLEARSNKDDPYQANPKLSITRIGGRAFPRALDTLAPQIRLGLAQAEDARRFKLDSAADPQAQKADAMNLRMSAALTQRPGNPATLEEQVVTVIAIQQGYADQIPPEKIPAYLTKAYKFVQAGAFSALTEIRTTRMLTATSEKAITNALTDLNKLLETQPL